jgi:hypothetical protein
MTVIRIAIQRRELEAALTDAPEGVLRRAAVAVANVMDGHTVVIEEQITVVGDEAIIEETILEATVPR